MFEFLVLTNIENIHDQFFSETRVRFLVRDFRASGTASQLNYLWLLLQVLGMPLLRPQHCQTSQCNTLLSDWGGRGGGHPCVSVFQVIDPPSKHTAAVNHCLPLETFSKNGHNSGNRKEISRSLRQKKDLNLFLTGIFFQTLEDWCFSLNFPIDRS